MHNFKKVIISSLSICLLFILLSGVVLVPYLHSEANIYQDSYFRDSLAGKIDTIINGASNSYCSLDPRIMDQKLNCFSYNLSGSRMTLNGRYFLLNKELQRNPVKTVILDISFETLIRNESTEHTEGDSIVFARLSSFNEQLQFLYNYVPLKDWPNVYTFHFFPKAVEYTIGSLKKVEPHTIDYSLKGFWPRIVMDLTLSKDDAITHYEEASINTEFKQDNIEKLIKIIDLCKSKGANVILVISPSSDSRLWQESGQDIFYEKIKIFSNEMHCSLYNLDLLKNRFELFSDCGSFFDGQHMSEAGAAVCTDAFCDILKKSETEDISQYFYDSYEEMKADSPYMQYLK